MEAKDVAVSNKVILERFVVFFLFFISSTTTFYALENVHIVCLIREIVYKLTHVLFNTCINANIYINTRNDTVGIHSCFSPVHKQKPNYEHIQNTPHIVDDHIQNTIKCVRTYILYKPYRNAVNMYMCM